MGLGICTLRLDFLSDSPHFSNGAGHFCDGQSKY